MVGGSSTRLTPDIIHHGFVKSVQRAGMDLLARFCFQARANYPHQGKVVLVTGGAKGIGRMISEGFVTNGATVYISSRDAKACDQAVQELNALGKGKAHAIPADFYKEEECQKLANELKKRENSE